MTFGRGERVRSGIRVYLSAIMQGDLSQINAADLAAHIFLSNLTGVLRLSQRTVRKNIYFINGRIVFGHSNLLSEKLGQILLRLGKINEDLFREVSRSLGPGKRLGQLLQEKGNLTESETSAAVNYQLQKIVYSVFNWDSGAFQFEEKSKPVHEDIIVEVSTPALIIGGIRNISNQRVLDRALPEESGIVFHEGSGWDFEWNDWNHAEETVLAKVNGELSIKELQDDCGLAPSEFARALYALTISGRIRIKDPLTSQSIQTGERYLSTKRKHDSDTPIVAQNILGKYSEAEIRELVELTAMKFLEVSDAEVLNLPPKPSSDQIQRHYDYLSGVFHPCYYSTDRYHDLKHTLKYIVDRLSEAYQNLTARSSGSGNETAAFYAADPEPFPLLEWWKKKQSASPIPAPADMDPSPAPDSFYLAGAGEFEMFQDTDQPLDQPDLSVRLSEIMEFAAHLQHSGKMRDAETQLLKALELDPRNPDTHFALSEFYRKQGLKFKAFKHLNIILQLDPNNQKALDMLGLKRRKRAMYDIAKNS